MTAEFFQQKEVNDARILADCGIAEIPLLVTSDPHILDADPNALSLAFQDAGLSKVSAADPARLGKIYKKSR
jgi:hypothetical protein